MKLEEHKLTSFELLTMSDREFFYKTLIGRSPIPDLSVTDKLVQMPLTAHVELKNQPSVDHLIYKLLVNAVGPSYVRMLHEKYLIIRLKERICFEIAKRLHRTNNIYFHHQIGTSEIPRRCNNHFSKQMSRKCLPTKRLDPT